jgi:hypothetical protein
LPTTLRPPAVKGQRLADGAVVARLRSEGMTQQAIADALGVSNQTMMRDCEFVHVDKLDDVPEQPDTVVGALPRPTFGTQLGDRVDLLSRDHPAGGSWAASSVT